MCDDKRIFILHESFELNNKLLLSNTKKYAKGFIRLGHDVQFFPWSQALNNFGNFKVKNICIRPFRGVIHKHCYKKACELVYKQIKLYQPDLILVGLSKLIDIDVIDAVKDAGKDAFILGVDGDPWPERYKNRINVAAKLDMVISTVGGIGVEAYRKAGVNIQFMPNPCDPDFEKQYNTDGSYIYDVFFSGQIYRKRYGADDMRPAIVKRLQKCDRSKICGCMGNPPLYGMDYYKAISRSKIGLSINADNSFSMYHSDRLTHYLSCGTMAIAKRVPDADRLFVNQKHIRYFDTEDEFFDLVNYYLAHEDERLKIAQAGMEHIHKEFNCEKIAQYILDLVNKGTYSAPWI